MVKLVAGEEPILEVVVEAVGSVEFVDKRDETDVVVPMVEM